MPKKVSTITDIKSPGQTKPSATARPIVVSDRPMVANDPMMVTDNGSEQVPAADEPKTAPIVSRTAKTLQPMHDAEELATDESAPTPEAETQAEVAAATEASTDDNAPAPGKKDVVTAKPDGAESEAPTPAAPAAEDTAESAPAEATPAAETPAADDDTQPADAAQNDDEAAAEDAAAREREAEMQKLIDSRQFFVPVNAVEQKRSIRTSIWLTLLVIVLAVVLVDFMLDANVILLLTKLPHTHFFTPNPHF